MLQPILQYVAPIQLLPLSIHLCILGISASINILTALPAPVMYIIKALLQTENKQKKNGIYYIILNKEYRYVYVYLKINCLEKKSLI